MPDAAAPATPATPRASIFEDFIDIFYAPSSVFERRRDANPWPTILIVTGLFIVASYIVFTLLGPVFQAEMERGLARAMADNPNITAEQAQAMRSFGSVGTMVTLALFVPLTSIVMGLVLWLAGKAVGATQTIGAAMLVVALSIMPRVLESLLSAIQAFVLDVNSLTSQAAVSLSPARFLDADTASPALVMLLMRLSPFIIWSYVLIAIGLAVTGRVSRQKAAVVAVVLWLLGALPTVLPALRAQ